jgi:hypothetical protein
MTSLSDDDIDRIGRGVRDRTLPKAEWTHEAHFAAALWLLRRNGAGAFQIMPGLIRAYNEATGVANTDTGGYHETITQASLHVALARLNAGAPDASLARVLEDMMADRYGASRWILTHWSRERLFTPDARKRWVEPDLAPLPVSTAELT